MQGCTSESHRTCAQEKVAKFLRVKQMQNREIKSELRQSRAYRNPSFLQKMVEHSDIKEFGSNLPAEVFDPDNLHEEVTPPVVHCMQQLNGAARWTFARAGSLPKCNPGSIVRWSCQQGQQMRSRHDT